MATIVVGGALANRRGNGGGAWVRLNWVIGLRRLGHTVHLVEEITRAACTDAAGRPVSFAASVNLAFFRSVATDFGIGDGATLVYDKGEQIEGLSFKDLASLCDSADLLINLGGHLAEPTLFGRFRRKVYVDLDPGFTQFWHAAGNPGARLDDYDEYYTVGTNIGHAGCPIPTGDLPWRPVRPPVVLEHWPAPAADTCTGRRFTTVASWRGPFGPIEFGGQTYGLKVHEFRKVIDLPRLAGFPFEVALDIHPADAKDLVALNQHGWHVTDPATVAGDPHAFRRYILGSAAEFSPAQGVYVGTRSGWFSDRTACYLAAGRPALVQDTGADLPTDEGLLTYRTLEEAANGVQRITSDYQAHARAARVLAEDYLDSDRVLGRFLDELGVAR